jgi:hypothetical protein
MHLKMMTKKNCISLISGSCEWRVGDEIKTPRGHEERGRSGANDLTTLETKWIIFEATIQSDRIRK